jgi:hypothetical protein
LHVLNLHFREYFGYVKPGSGIAKMISSFSKRLKSDKLANCNLDLFCRRLPLIR